MNEGYPFKQAVAIAYDKEKKKKGDEGLTTDPTDPKKSGTASDSLNVSTLKSGIAQVESGGGQEIFMINPDPNSTATGLYGQRFSEIEGEYEGSRTQFSTDIQAQEEYMDERIEEGINAPSLRRNAIDLTVEYKDQLGDKWDYTQNEVAALSHFLGRQGTRNYFAAIRDGEDFVVPGTNKTPDEYLKTFNEGEAKIKMRGGTVRPIKRGDNGVTTGEETEDPKDDDVYSVTHEDIYNYLANFLFKPPIPLISVPTLGCIECISSSNLTSSSPALLECIIRGCCLNPPSLVSSAPLPIFTPNKVSCSSPGASA